MNQVRMKILDNEDVINIEKISKGLKYGRFRNC